MLHISLAPEILFHIGTFPITNTFLVSLFITLMLMSVAFLVSLGMAWRPTALQNFVELVFEKILQFMDSITEERKQSAIFFPLVVTIFLFVLFSNLIELLPGLGTIGLREELHGKTAIIPFIRSSSADLNVTIAISIISVIGVQIFGIAAVGFFRHFKKFFYPPWQKPYFIGTFVGILELIAEVAKIVSFSFRLFGNIFAGEVLLTVILFLLPIGASVPFLALEIFVGLIQAVVFSMLTLVFIKVATAHGEH